MANASEEFRRAMSHGFSTDQTQESMQAELLKRESERSTRDGRATELPEAAPADPAEAVAAEPAETAEATEAESAGEVAAEPAVDEPAVEAGPEAEADPEVALVELEDGSHVPLPDLVKGNLRQADYTKKTTALAQERADFEQQRQAVAEKAQQGMQHVATLAQTLEAELAKHRPSPQAMSELRNTDPAEYAARIAEQQQQDQLIALAQAEQHRLMAERQAAVIPQQRAALQQQNPAFAGDKFDAEYKDLGEYAISPDGGGLHREEWDQLVDHRHVNLVWKAREYDKATRNASRLPKKLAKVPKVIRPGVPRDERDTASEGLSAALANQAADGGSLASTVEAFRAKERMRNAR